MSLLNRRLHAGLGAATLLAASVLLIGLRGGLLSVAGLVIAVLLLAKVVWRPAPSDLGLVAAAVLALGLVWAAVWYYVKGTWESGEVVSLRIETPAGQAAARLWVVDQAGEARMYYDAPADIAAALLAGTPVEVTRSSATVKGCASAVRVDSLPEAAQAEFLALMNHKYGDASAGAEVFYLVLGGYRSRIPLLLGIRAC